MYDSTSTFKTRRKHHLLLLTWLATLIHNVTSMPSSISCPEPCECYLNHNGLQSAKCSMIYTNQTSFPNIHVLVLNMSENQDQCDIPKELNEILPQLNYLYMMNCSLTEIPVHAFESLTFLQEIDLSNNLIEKIEPAWFVNNAKLTYANMQNNPLRVFKNEPFLTSKSLTDLDLSSCGITDLPLNIFKNLTKLKYLMLYNNELTTIEYNTLPGGLKSINLGKNSIQNVPIGELERLKKLREIDLSQNPINCTCSTLSFQDQVIAKPQLLKFLNNGMECMHPAKYRGKLSVQVPSMEICAAERAALQTDENEDKPNYRELHTNEIMSTDKSGKKKHKKGKKDNIQEDFERDEVVPYDKKYIDEMQSDSVPDEGSGGGAGEDHDTTDRTDIISEVIPSDKKSNNTENNETKPGAPDSVPNPDITQDTKTGQYSTEQVGNSSPVPNSDTAVPPEQVDTKITNDTSNQQEILNANTVNNETLTATSTQSEPIPELTTVSEIAPTPAPASPSQPTETPAQTTTESSKIETEAVSTTSPLEPEPKATETGFKSENSSSPPNIIALAPDTITESRPENPISTQSTTTEKLSTLTNALQKDDSNTFNLGYIIPCLAILIVILICLGIYLGQRRSSHKNWEPATNTNDGAELQDVSLLPENGKMPIVKNKKYPTEGNSEQTERLMNDSNSSAPKSVWEHLEEPFENGNSKQAKDSERLPNGESNDKNEPIECAIVKVTTLPDSIPRTPLIRNT